MFLNICKWSTVSHFWNSPMATECMFLKHNDEYSSSPNLLLVLHIWHLASHSDLYLKIERLNPSFLCLTRIQAQNWTWDSGCSGKRNMFIWPASLILPFYLAKRLIYFFWTSSCLGGHMCEGFLESEEGLWRYVASITFDLPLSPGPYSGANETFADWVVQHGNGNI